MATPLPIRSPLDSSRHSSIFPPPSPQYSSQHTPSFSLPSIPSPSSFPRPPSPERSTHSTSRPFESDTFLTLIAAQERKVLELKEEMHKAEVDLEKLKKQWAVHEARKKRSELRGSKRLEPLSVPKTASTMELGIDTFGGNAYENKGPNGDYRDPEKPRTRRSESVKKPPRRVFQGSRHAKTLSLLSPTALTNQDLHALRSPPPDHPASDISSAQNKLSRADTTPTPLNTNVQSSGIPLSTSAGSPTRPKDAILYPAKQLVGDFREGLWTFFEDLRQAAVGDDISGGDPRHVKRGSISREGKQQGDDQQVKCNDDAIIEEHRKLEDPSRGSPPQKKKEERRTRARRTSSKNDGYAFKLDQGLEKAGAGEVFPRASDPNTPPSLKAPPAQIIPLPTRSIIPAHPKSLQNPSTPHLSSSSSSDLPSNTSSSSTIIPNDPDPDGWNTWDSSPVAPQRSTPRPLVGSTITTTTTTTTLPSSPSLASPSSSTTPTTDAATSSTGTTTTANSSVRTSLTSLGAEEKEEADSDTTTPKPNPSSNFSGRKSD